MEADEKINKILKLGGIENKDKLEKDFREAILLIIRKRYFHGRFNPKGDIDFHGMPSESTLDKLDQTDAAVESIKDFRLEAERRHIGLMFKEIAATYDKYFTQPEVDLNSVFKEVTAIIDKHTEDIITESLNKIKETKPIAAQ